MTTTLRDAHGQALSTTDRASLAAYEHALDLFHSFRTDPVAVLTPVLERDPGFVSGQLLMAGMLLTAFDGQLHGMAKACVDAAAASPQKANEREQSLIAALGAWSSGDALRANRLLGRHLIDHPRDLFALQLAHLGDLFLGHSFMLRDRVARSLTQWSADDKGYGYLLGMHAFGLEECNDYARAESVGRRAFELQPHDSWAVHAVAHVCEMQGRSADGIRWLKATQRHWATDCGMAVHNHWHLALMHMGSGEMEAALALYDDAVAPAPEAIALNLDDASALLWRFGLRGVDVSARWQALAARWRLQAAWGVSAFNDVHAVMALAAAGDDSAAKAGIAAIAEAAHGPAAQAAAAAAVALPAASALHAFAAGRYAQCVELLLPVLAASSPLGGSHAQRDLLHLTVIEAASRAGDRALVRAMGDERAARKAVVAARPARVEDHVAA
ncbi:tetratricopeptide repeat protein [Variovorax sp. MHTC-1]|uniref:tetratricopeptide repeat protein n=1 Tax=Variovorax sp. MHTC-1 TaxID=2495593 RepID=UPI000F861CAA|nr:tetratricopeptide repeat protein [Variovorax sp. MHTC-1]RST48995.1 tetratricopeptide repeat protein [Variovorax sp. MHTC-1]